MQIMFQTGVGKDLRLNISNQLPGDAIATGPGTTL